MWGEATWEYLHLLAVPFPLALTVAAALVGVAGWIAGREGLERWSVLSLVLAGVLAVPAYVTGLTAADVASARTFVEPSLVQTHRAWATWTVVLLVAQAVFGAFSLLQPGDRRLRRFVVSVGVVAAVLVGWSAYLGGTIVHGPATDTQRIQERVGGSVPPDSPTAPATEGTPGPAGAALDTASPDAGAPDPAAREGTAPDTTPAP